MRHSSRRVTIETTDVELENFSFHEETIIPFVQKPFTGPELVRQVREALDQ